LLNVKIGTTCVLLALVSQLLKMGVIMADSQIVTATCTAKFKWWFKPALFVCRFLPFDSRSMAEWLALNAVTISTKPKAGS
jgi:hypothetical protein